MAVATDEIRVLYAGPDSDAGDVGRLDATGGDFDLVTVPTTAAALERLTGTDCLVTRAGTAELDALSFVEQVRRYRTDLPVFVLLPVGADVSVTEVLDAGATDAIPTDTDIDSGTLLANRVENAVDRPDPDGPDGLSLGVERLVSSLDAVAYRCQDPERPMGLVEGDAESLAGYTAAALEQDVVWGRDVIADDSAGRHSAVRSVLDGRARFEISYRITTADGRTKWVCERGVSVQRAGETVAVEGVITDITDRKEYEQRLEHRVEAMDTSMDGMAILDPDGQYTYVNEARAEVYGYDDVDQFLGESWRLCYDDDELERFEAEVMPALFAEGEWRGTATGRRADGSTFPQALSLTTLDDGGIVCVVRDITERVQRERRLEIRQRALRRAYEVIANQERGFETQVDDLLGIVQEVVGTGYATFSRVDGGEYVFEAVRTPDDVDLEPGDTTPLDTLPNCRHVVRTRERLVLEDVAAQAPEFVDPAFGIACYLGTPVVVDDEVYGTFCFYDTEPREEAFSDWAVAFVDLLGRWVSSELTRRRALARARRQNERLEEFVSIVSHDLRNPLSVIEGSLDLAAATGDDEHFQRCYRSVERMGSLVDELLTLAKAGRELTEPEPVALDAVARESWAVVDTGDATLTVDTSATVEADAGRLRQVFENLFRNAVEHGVSDTTTAGELTVTVGDLADGFYVADDGCGVPADEREAVFEPGYTTTDDGTGFGLKITREVAQAHGWAVSVCESDGGGAEFRFRGVAGD